MLIRICHSAVTDINAYNVINYTLYRKELNQCQYLPCISAHPKHCFEGLDHGEERTVPDVPNGVQRVRVAHPL